MKKMNRYYLGKSGEKVPSYFDVGKVYDGEKYKEAALQLWGNDFLEKSTPIIQWEEFYKKNIGHFIVGVPNQVKRILPRNIIFEFKKIRTVAHVKRFAGKYGLLGINNLNHNHIVRLTDINNPLELGYAPIEPIELWYDCARKIRSILNLYEAIQIAFEEKSELDLECEEVKSGQITVGYLYKWVYVDEGKKIILSTFLDQQAVESVELHEIANQQLKIGQMILIQAIKPFIADQIHIEEKIVENEHTSIGIEIVELKYTTTLISSIFYDLWLMFVANVPVARCKICNQPFIQSEYGRKKISCSDSCRKTRSRKNKEE